LIVLAETKQAIIISGDRVIVNACRKRGREAHGILWLLDENERVQRRLTGKTISPASLVLPTYQCTCGRAQ
jgi:hypothetical protein